jgi:hypothetical protein
MKNLFELISEEEYNLIEDKLFQDHHNRRFGKINASNGKSYAVGWRSDLLLPQIDEIQPGSISIGIDQKFAIISFIQNEKVLEIDLHYNFSESVFESGRLLVATELEVIEISSPKWKINRRVSLPSYFEKFTFENNIVKIECIDGELITW